MLCKAKKKGTSVLFLGLAHPSQPLAPQVTQHTKTKNFAVTPALMW